MTGILALVGGDEFLPDCVPMDRARPLSILKRLAPQSVIDRMIAGLIGEGS